jgi:hypothetical protein
MQHDHLPINGIKYEGLPDSTKSVNSGEGAEAQPCLTPEELGAFIGSIPLEHYDSAPTQITQPDEQARAAAEYRENYPMPGFNPHTWGS